MEHSEKSGTTLAPLLAKAVKHELQELYRFALRYVTYMIAGTLITLFLGFLVESGLEKTIGYSFSASIRAFVADQKNIQSTLTFALALLFAFGSATYVVVRHLPDRDQLGQSLSTALGTALTTGYADVLAAVNDNASTLREAISQVRTSVDQMSICDTLKIIGYKELMNVEQSCQGLEITIITNSLSDDASDSQILPIIVDNLRRGKYYHFIIPDTAQNRRDAEALQRAVADERLPVSSGVAKSFIHFASDEMFKICAFRDIAIYGSSATESKYRIGYAELPGLLKTDDATPRSFMEIDKEVCKNLVTDIDVLLKRRGTGRVFESVPIAGSL